VTQTTDSGTGAIRSGDDVRIMFGRITRRYDLMNRIMTGGRDVAWRRLAVRAALAGHARGTARVLDVATGTGDLALALERGGAGFVAGLDFSSPMLELAAAKSRAANRDSRAEPAWILGDALSLPFADGAFDACTVGFGLRNMPDYRAALTEMARVIRPGGRLVCLEMTPLRAPVIGGLFGWHFAHVVPLVGGLVSGDRDAYRYLPQSVAAFPDAPTLAAMMRSAGFAGATWRTLGAGTVALHVAVKARN
jgi:demethylmenaquinone methyltransferase/2-methoxy-6-polyprenyl-1,4-benzoquinol methylase